MSDTPRTDAKVFNFLNAHPSMNINQDVVRADFARDLERENAALRAEVESLKHDIERTTQRNNELIAEVEQLKVDAERLDCLQSRMLAIDFDYGEKHEHALVFKWGDSPVMANLRMTLDAARKESNG